jgi:hypothetical protein
MKQVITFVIAALFTLSSFASAKPVKLLSNGEVKSIIKNRTTLKVNLRAGGKVNIGWMATTETSTTTYNIQKSINGGTFKTVAILMGESNDSYFFRDNIKDFTGDVQYRVVTVDNNIVVKTLTQDVLVF